MEAALGKSPFEIYENKKLFVIGVLEILPPVHIKISNSILLQLVVFFINFKFCSIKIKPRVKLELIINNEN